MKILTTEEVPLLLPAAHAFYEEAKLPGSVVDDVFVASWVNLIKSGSGVVFAELLDGKVIGTLGVIVYNDLCDGAKVAVEAFWYVMPGNRGMIGSALYGEFELWARTNSVKRMAMIRLEGLNDRAMHEFYVKKGYRILETMYVKEL